MGVGARGQDTGPARPYGPALLRRGRLGRDPVSGRPPGPRCRRAGSSFRARRCGRFRSGQFARGWFRSGRFRCGRFRCRERGGRRRPRRRRRGTGREVALRLGRGSGAPQLGQRDAMLRRDDRRPRGEVRELGVQLESQHLATYLPVGRGKRRQLGLGWRWDLVVAADEQRAEGPADLAACRGLRRLRRVLGIDGRDAGDLDIGVAVQRGAAGAARGVLQAFHRRGTPRAAYPGAVRRRRGGPRRVVVSHGGAILAGRSARSHPGFGIPAHARTERDPAGRWRSVLREPRRRRLRRPPTPTRSWPVASS